MMCLIFAFHLDVNDFQRGFLFDRLLESVHQYVEIGKTEGAKLLIGGEKASAGELAKRSFYKPTLFADVTSNMRIAQEEIFGPVLSVITVESLAEAIEVNIYKRTFPY